MVTVRKPQGGPFRATVTLNEEAMRRVAKRLRGAAAKVHNHRATVGIHEQEAMTPQPDYQGTTHGQTVGEVAAIQEFGAGNVPPRSFVRDWFDERQRDLAQRMKQAMQEEYSSGEYSGRERSTAMVSFGEDVLNGMVQRIRDGIDPPLADVTIKRRADAGIPADPPLIATGHLVRALRAKIDGFEVAKGQP